MSHISDPPPIKVGVRLSEPLGHLMKERVDADSEAGWIRRMCFSRFCRVSKAARCFFNSHVCLRLIPLGILLLPDSAGSGFRAGSGSRVGMDFMGRMLTLILTNIYQPADALMTPEPLRLQGGPGWVQGTTPTDASRKHGAVKALSSAGGRRSSLLN